MINYTQELQEELENQEATVKALNSLGEDLALQDRKDNGEQIKNQLDAINTRWTTVFSHLSDIKRRQVLLFLVLTYCNLLYMYLIKNITLLGMNP